MNKIDQLWIRACKSKNPRVRTQSLRRRFYILMSNDDRYIVLKLAELCDKYVPISAAKLLEELTHPFVMRDYAIQEKLFYFYLNQIRFARIDEFPGLTIPRRFK